MAVLDRQTDDNRLYGLDWLRAGAAVLVVTLHAGIAYLVARMPGLAWPTHDPSGHPTVDAITWWINGFIMPLFFVQSGYLACQIMCAKGPEEFLKHRTRRLLAPFALGCVLILPLDLYAWLLGWAGEGKITLHKLRSLKIDSPLGDNLWGVSHLWFLQYLWLFCLCAWGMWRVAEWQSGKVTKSPDGKVAESNGLKSRQSFGKVTVALLGISTFALWWEPQLVIGFRHSWWPQLANLLFYAPWFTLGWLNFSSREAQGERNSHRACELRLLASLGMFAILLPLIHQHVADPLQGPARVVLATLFVTHAWLAVTGWFGVCLRWLNRQPPAAVKYIAEASFWIYLFHHPVVGLTQVSLSQAPLPVAIRFLLTTLIGMVLPLLTYHAFVRQTWIGVVLSGRRQTVLTEPDSSEILPFPQPEARLLKKSA
ncbi:MAG: acyltransferase family protein [Planctomycetaceae bacterium]|nr:acyltransferase family protein [Planctomycetaceae bacterium]